MNKFKNKQQNIFLIILATVLVLCFIVLEILESKTKNIIIENRNDFEMFDKCYLVEEYYYCEKAN